MVKFDEDDFSAVEVVRHVDQIYEVFHTLRTVNAEHSIRMHGFE